ncbi:zf-HC2 domain-containing protein [Corynebacterium heidelbergense]|uniref:zf-HC2 domain-containing protein n=1 Tax=Corynebacterium heidelbergense TaxID=2055947 RepID=UPI001EE7371F|nr:zf-HC2 domain-containing protein [Corynebacterium heidelbergense]
MHRASSAAVPASSRRAQAKGEEDRGLSVEHLSPEAMAALVDGELSSRAEHRAKVHLVHCGECRAEVQLQRKAAALVRSMDADVQCSGRLKQKLAAIPQMVEEARPAAHFGVDGCRRPESIVDAVDLALRKLQRRQK